MQSSALPSLQTSDMVVYITLAVAASYFVGWIETMAYFRAFNAEWLVDEASPISFLKQGGKLLSPILLLLACLFVFQEMFLEGVKVGKIAEVSALTALITGSIAIISLQFSNQLASSLIGEYIAFFLPVAFWIILGAFILCVSVRKPAKDRVRLNRLSISIAGVVLLGLFWIPIIRGKVHALRHLNPDRSTLLIVEPQNSNTDSPPLRVLLSTEKCIFAIRLERPAAFRNVTPIPWDKVSSIRAPE